jgi:hypothetical protein
MSKVTPFLAIFGGKNRQLKSARRQFGGKKSAIEIGSPSIWREEIGN